MAKRSKSALFSSVLIVVVLIIAGISVVAYQDGFESSEILTGQFIWGFSRCKSYSFSSTDAYNKADLTGNSFCASKGFSGERACNRAEYTALVVKFSSSDASCRNAQPSGVGDRVVRSCNDKLVVQGVCSTVSSGVRRYDQRREDIALKIRCCRN